MPEFVSVNGIWKEKETKTVQELQKTEEVKEVKKETLEVPKEEMKEVKEEPITKSKPKRGRPKGR